MYGSDTRREAMQSLDDSSSVSETPNSQPLLALDELIVIHYFPTGILNFFKYLVYLFKEAFKHEYQMKNKVPNVVTLLPLCSNLITCKLQIKF